MKRHARPLLKVTLVLLAVLLVVRLALPYVVLGVLNRHMDAMGDYHGHVDDVDLQVWRGAYSLKNLKVIKVSGKVPVPLLNAPRMDVVLSWAALVHGGVRGHVSFQSPVLNFVDGSGHADTQAGTGVDWRRQLQRLVPVRLDRVDVHDGTVTFRNFVSQPRVDLKMTDVQARVRNLTNADRSQGSRVATLQARARVLGDAPLTAHAQFDPLVRFGDFSFTLHVRHVDLPHANALARAYANLDFASGTGDFTMELDAHDGQLHGYAQPIFHDMKIFSWKQDVEQQHENPLHAAWEAAAQGLSWLFTNHTNGQFATRVPISGRIDDRHLQALPSIVNVLRNAFIKAYTPHLHHLKPAPDAAHG